MSLKLKPRKCRLRSCRKEFDPVTEWQKYCSGRCRSAVANHKRAELVRHAQRSIEAREKGAA